MQEKVFLEISQNLLENTCARVSFLIKLEACNFIKKETLAQVFSCEFCDISKNTCSYRTPPVGASVHISKSIRENTYAHYTVPEPFFNKVAGLRHRCFPLSFVKFLRTPFFLEHLCWLLLV